MISLPIAARRSLLISCSVMALAVVAGMVFRLFWLFGGGSLLVWLNNRGTVVLCQ